MVLLSELGAALPVWPYGLFAVGWIFTSATVLSGPETMDEFRIPVFEKNGPLGRMWYPVWR